MSGNKVERAGSLKDMAKAKGKKAPVKKGAAKKPAKKTAAKGKKKA